MSLVYDGVPGLAVPGGLVPGLPYIPAAPPAVLRRGVVSISAAGPLAAAVTISAAGPLAAAVTITQPS
jgi:hypothetical protein